MERIRNHAKKWVQNDILFDPLKIGPDTQENFFTRSFIYNQGPFSKKIESNETSLIRKIIYMTYKLPVTSE